MSKIDNNNTSLNDEIKKEYFKILEARYKIYKNVYGKNGLNKLLSDELNNILTKNSKKLKDKYIKLLNEFKNETQKLENFNEEQ